MPTLPLRSVKRLATNGKPSATGSLRCMPQPFAALLKSPKPTLEKTIAYKETTKQNWRKGSQRCGRSLKPGLMKLACPWSWRLGLQPLSGLTQIDTQSLQIDLFEDVAELKAIAKKHLHSLEADLL
jgi:hypothetical protein